jgi:tetratricopeptide (TPR) repeat protein
MAGMDPYCRKILGQLETAHENLHFRRIVQILLASGKERIDWDRIEKSGDELIRLKIYSMSAEIYDYAGEYAQAREAVEADARKSLLILQEPSAESLKNRKLLKQRVWILIHWALTFYRAHHYRKAKELLFLCDETLKTHLITEDDKCAWTQSRIYYCLGLVQRQTYDYKAARHWFTKSIELAWESFELKTANLVSTDVIYQRVRRLTSFYVAKSLALGLAWTYYTEGSLEISSSLVRTARFLLAGTNESVILNYIKILSASILASQGRRQEAIETLMKAHKELNGCNHHAYRIRAANELAVAYVHEFARDANPENRLKAVTYIEEVKQFSDVRWMANALVTESRLLRALKDFKGAEKAAAEAFKVGGDQRFVKIDALIACGEARLELDKIKEACKDFQTAQREGLDNPKVQAVCHLHLARAYLQKGDYSLARRHQAEATRHLNNVDNAFVAHLAETVEGMLEKAAGADFYIPFSISELHRREVERKLRGFLTKWAKHKAGGETEPWKMLGISKQTFYTWQSESKASDDSRKSRKDNQTT